MWATCADEGHITRRKGKKKGKKKARADRDEGEDDLDEQESVDDILDALAAEAGNLSCEAATSVRNEHEQTLLGVQLKFANADKEMKRIFGKVKLVTPLDEWPRPPTFVGGGIRWTRANKPKGPGWNSLCNYFEVTWSMAYKKRYPYHIDALLTMSQVFQHHGQMDHAADSIKRCMYVLELAWADQFDVSKGDCRMDIQAEHNDGFFKALALLMKQVGRRGCMRSAFETAKLLLSLDPQGDPMNVLLAIDYYALTSRQCQFLVDLFDAKIEAVDRFATSESGSKKKKAGKRAATNATETISALPNLQFSLALAQYEPSALR
ncbi:hypothetical protein BBJ28_00000992 [Nothophytophthora sp. Chile5]|nr:hypothetical protein BBJ28_00000992 [Nothophytophthora sp. Chile5]